MKSTTLETIGQIVNGLSLAALFFLATTLDLVAPPTIVQALAWGLFAVGMLLVLLCVGALMRNRGKGLIDGGVYGLVRHPMYVGAIILFLSWILFLPHWIILIIAVGNAAIVYWHILQGERRNVETFGSAYRTYMESVPRANLLAGLLRCLRGA
jgi:protein-S-isoprenylcysteine O-methyltransferase Ste14